MAEHATKALIHFGNWLQIMDIRKENAMILVMVPPFSPRLLLQQTASVESKGFAIHRYPMPIFISVDCSFSSIVKNELAKMSAIAMRENTVEVIIRRKYCTAVKLWCASFHLN
mmetsp:Transcript_31558/g.57758  ORF Transcript_31558/g.57758 Transcript_31558/m.57758 type:complete len:113 (-) Transcript_31558:418-756(-)